MTNITEQSLASAREHFASLCEACIKGATSGEFYVNNLHSYIQSETKMADEFRAGKWDHTFTVRQWAYYVQTGTCVALLG